MKVDTRPYMMFVSEEAAENYTAMNDLLQWSDRIRIVKVEPLAFVNGREIPVHERGKAFWAIKDKYQNYLRTDGRF